ncbi:hypothetical protein GWI33_019547 [Rhynchophorus ferrugineus]|uniref:Uncharacterized protein n=1 Tax=Rhynchophorus ferrugineus TaxID=354439 RepID=A0A834HTM0_RHYFE|nr:hypothetical protein GWI33_019547 [Rhynchophorus ferrugineus]
MKKVRETKQKGTRLLESVCSIPLVLTSETKRQAAAINKKEHETPKTTFDNYAVSQHCTVAENTFVFRGWSRRNLPERDCVVRNAARRDFGERRNISGLRVDGERNEGAFFPPDGRPNATRATRDDCKLVERTSSGFSVYSVALLFSEKLGRTSTFDSLLLRRTRPT